MPMDSISIRDFQTHKSLDLKLSPEITTIIGPNDVGKSAILRALQWVALNRPAGDAFIRDGARDAIVQINLKNKEIIRSRGAKGNLYKIDEIQYEAFGNDVPPTITTILNLSTLNFQGQYEGPFWFSETSGEVSRQLNQIVNLGIIDHTLANLASMLRKAGTEVEIVKDRLQQAETERKRLKPARQMDTDLQQVEGLAADLVREGLRTHIIDALAEDIKTHTGLVKRLSRGILVGKRALNLGEGWAKTRNRREVLKFLVDSVTSLQKVAHQTIPNLKPLEVLNNTWQHAKGRRESLESLVRATQKAKENTCQVQEEARTVQREFTKAMGKICPLCGQRIQS